LTRVSAWLIENVKSITIYGISVNVIRYQAKPGGLTLDYLGSIDYIDP